MARRKIRGNVGDIFSIDLGDDIFCFGRILNNPLMAFYDCKSKEMKSLDLIINSPIIFKVWVMNYAITSGRWKIIGNLPVNSDLLANPKFFKQDNITRKLSIYHDGEEIPATFEDCLGLECAAVWDPEHVEDRLRDYFRKIPNKWVESMRIK